MYTFRWKYSKMIWGKGTTKQDLRETGQKREAKNHDLRETGQKEIHETRLKGNRTVWL